jgi:hypothetical protein
MTCSLCGQEILDERHWYEQWVAWHTTRKRMEGGTHDKGRLPRRTGAFAHERCVDMMRAGRAIGQGGLFQEELFG